MRVKKIKNYKSYIFDCDGVILKSNKIKTDAFIHTFSDFPRNDVDNLIKYHKLNGGISRYEKIKFFFEKILNKNTSSYEIKKYLQRFGDYSYGELQRCDLIEGVFNYINFLYKNNNNLFIISGSDEDELKKIFLFKNLSKYFNSIYGSPINKYDLLKKILHNIDTDQTIFFGDSKIDYEVSSFYKIDFIYVEEDSEWLLDKRFEKLNKINNFNCLNYE